MKRLLIVLLCVCPVLLRAEDRRTEEETFDRTVAFAPGGALSVKTVNGDIALNIWDRSEIRILARKRASADTAERAREILSETEIEIEASPDNVRIVTRHPDDKSLLKRADVHVDYTLSVPKAVELKLETVNGSVKVPGTHGRLDAETVNGHIDVREVHGPIEAEAVNGTVDLIDIRGSVEAETVNGEIEIAMAADTGESIHAETLNGGIRLSLPKGFAARLHASTVNGSIKTDFPIAVKGRFWGKSLKGDINGGGQTRIRLETLNGGIRITEK